MLKLPPTPGLPAFTALSLFILAAIAYAALDDRLSLSFGSEFWTQVSATILGAVVAAGFSYWLARYAIWQSDRAQGFQLLIKVSLIANDLGSTMRAIDACLVHANNHSDTGLQMWQRVLPIVGNIPVEVPSPSELAPLFASGHDRLGNQVIEISMRYHNFRTSLDKYNQLRSEIRDLMPVHEVDSSESQKGMTSLNAADFAKLRPRFMELENLIRVIVRDGRADLKQINNVADDLGPALRRVFRDSSFPVLRVPTSN